MSLNNKILVTGGLGYIGSHTVIELINAGFEPIIVDNLSNSNIGVEKGIFKISGKNVKIHYFDCSDYDSLFDLCSNNQFHGVIHFASLKNVNESISEPLKYYTNNINSTTTVLRVMQKCQIKNFVFSSTCAVYGDAVVLPVTEDTPVSNTKSPYANTKKICENIISDICKVNSNLNAVVLRYFNPIGAHPSSYIGEAITKNPANLLPILMQVISSNKDFLIHGNVHDTHDGTCIRDFIHVCDLAKSHVKAFEFLQKKCDSKSNLYTYNIGTGNGCSILEMIQLFESVTNKKLNYKVGTAREGDISKMYANAEKANYELNWKCEKSLKEAIQDAWNWFQDSKNQIEV